MASTPVSAEVVPFAEFEADLRSRELRKNGAKVRVPDQSFQVLAMLLERPGQLVSREEIQKRLWPSDTFVDFDHGLNNAVNRLREALGDSAGGPRFIETLPKRGYRFIGRTDGRSSATAELHKPRDHRWQIPSVAFVLLIAFIFMFVTQKTSLSPPIRSFVLPQDGTTFNLIGDNGGSVTLSPDGTKLAFVALNAKGIAQLWIRPLGKLAAEAVDGTAGATFPFWSPDGRMLGFFADGKLKKISVEGGQSLALCDAPFGRGGSWNHAGVIIFAPTSHSGIYKVSDSGGVSVPITTVDSSIHTTHRWPKFLPDGRHFIYLAASHTLPAEQNGIYLGSVDGYENKLLVRSDADGTYASGYLFFLRNESFVAQPFDLSGNELRGNAHPTAERVLYDPSIWKCVFDASQNGVLAYQLGNKVTGTQLRWVDRSGKQIAEVGEPGFLYVPRLSRDGRKLAVGVANGGYGYSNLWSYDIASGAGTQITFNKHDNGSPLWSLDGTRILFTGKRQHYGIYQVDSSGAAPERLVLDTGGDTWPLDLSPDGRFLLYGQGVTIGRTRRQLWIYSMRRERAPFRLLGGEAVEDDGQFSPDGRWVAYTSNQSGRDEVYVLAFQCCSGSSEGARNSAIGAKISLSGGHGPKWRKDGKELFYMAEDGTVIAVPIKRTGPRLDGGVPHPLFRANPGLNFSYDVSSDGNRFIVSSAAPETTAPITLVENWLSDFRD